MNLIKVLFLLFIFVISIVNSKVYSQQKFDVLFDDGSEETVTFTDDDPNNIHKRYTTIGILKFRIISFGNISSASGPFILDFKHQRFIDSTDKMIEFNFYFTPIEGQKLESSGDYYVFPMSFDMNYRQSFSHKTKSKKRRLNFLKSNNWGTIYRVKLPVKFQRKYYYRLGTYYNQYSDGRSFKENGNYTSIESVKSLSLYVGISKFRMANLNYTSPNFGNQKTSFLSDIYFDVLFSPILYAYGKSSGYIDNKYTVFNDGKLNLSDMDLKKHPFGIRMGSSYKMPWTRRKIGSEYSYEIAYLPGIETNYFYFSVGLKLLFMK